MADLNANPRPKRGGFAKDRRTGQTVRVKETGGTDVLVRPAYKSDGFWVPKADLVPAQDPHRWTGMHLLGFLLVLLVQGVVSWGFWLTTAGDPFNRAVLVFTASLTTLGYLARWTGLLRV